MLRKISHMQSRRVASKLLMGRDKIMLNIGCGTDYKQGWINVDNNSDKNISKIDLSWDLRYALPISAESIDFIFNEHFLEHLSVEEGQASLKDFFRVMKNGAVMRIAMPDLEEVVAQYLDKNWRSRPNLKEFGLDRIPTSAELINISFRWWGHKWLYDFEELERRLKEAGFSNIRRVENGVSNYSELRGLETRAGSNLVVEVTK